MNIEGEGFGTKLNIDPDFGKKGSNIFEWTFNKELLLDEDEVPIVLYELHENSLLYMDWEEWDKALILLNKAQSIVEQLNLDNYRKDRMIIIIIFHNTAVCH